MLENLKNNQYLAVHFNFEANKLSLRAINPKTQKLNALLGLVDSIWLKDCSFTYDVEKWQKWRDALEAFNRREGSKSKYRQFAEIRGNVLATDQTEVPTVQRHKVIYTPHSRPDFYLDSGKTIYTAPLVHISGRSITAYKGHADLSIRPDM